VARVASLPSAAHTSMLNNNHDLLGCCMPTSHPEAQHPPSNVLPFIRSPPGLQSFFALHASSYVTALSSIRRVLLNEQLPLPHAITTAIGEAYALCLCHDSVAAASLQSQDRAHICSLMTARGSRLAVPPGWMPPRRLSSRDGTMYG
jgi:hypothetical protein